LPAPRAFRLSLTNVLGMKLTPPALEFVLPKTHRPLTYRRIDPLNH